MAFGPMDNRAMAPWAPPGGSTGARSSGRVPTPEHVEGVPEEAVTPRSRSQAGTPFFGSDASLRRGQQ